MSSNAKIAAASMGNQDLKVREISNNIANSGSTGFKESVFFTETNHYEDMRGMGIHTGNDDEIQPVGLEIGSGSRPSAVVTLHKKGEPMPTGNPLDFMVRGQGMFQLEGPDGQDFYTYAGNFTTNANGELVNLDGYKVKGPITIPQNAQEVVVNKRGEVFAKINGEDEPQALGQIELARFHNPTGLKKQPGTMYTSTPASGEAILGAPGNDGFGEIMSHTLEASNVNMIKSMTDLIQAQRAYEMNSRVVQAADDMEKRVEQLGG